VPLQPLLLGHRHRFIVAGPDRLCSKEANAGAFPVTDFSAGDRIQEKRGSQEGCVGLRGLSEAHWTLLRSEDIDLLPRGNGTHEEIRSMPRNFVWLQVEELDRRILPSVAPPALVGTMAPAILAQLHVHHALTGEGQGTYSIAAIPIDTGARYDLLGSVYFGG